jgi:GSCFA family
MSNPYVNLPQRAFWRPAVASRSLFDLDDLWQPKFVIDPEHIFVTFGSCFAQHIGRALQARGFSWYSAEPKPQGLSDTTAKLFNYDVFSARTGNIYTTSILAQWTQWATGAAAVPSEFWERDGRVFDPFRPAIEPNGFVSREEMVDNRAATIGAFRRCIETANYFVFTLGLTESWINADHGYEYPMCPGTAAGEFIADTHLFRNQTVAEISESLQTAMDMMREINPNLRFILTVSPVPLTATNSGNHVMVATMESKSILRAVAGQTAGERNDTDYFPSYELINSPVVKGVFFEPNQRDVNPHGVNYVMDRFFRGVSSNGENVREVSSKTTIDARTPADANLAQQDSLPDDVVCEEELLRAFETGK